MHHFKSIGEFKLELQPGNAQLGSKLAILCPAWPWNFGRSWKTVGLLFYTTLSFLQHSKSLVYSNWSYNPETLNSGQNWRFFVPRDLEIWWMTLKKYRAPLLYYIKFCAVFQSHWYIQPGVTDPETLISGQKWQLFVPRDLENWQMTLKNNRAPLLCCFKLCASLYSHWWIQTGVTVQKQPIWVKIDCAMWPWNLTDGLEK